MDRREGIALALVAAAALVAGGAALIPPHGVFRDPVSLTKKLAIVAIALTALAAPIAVAEMWSDRRFRRAADALRHERAWTSVAPYEGPEGRGLAFEAPDRRALLLHPAGGLGAPRVVEQPRPDVTGRGDENPPAASAHGSS